MTIFKTAVRLLSGVIFLFSGALMLLGRDEVYYRGLEYYGFGWSTADIIVRILAFLFVFSGVTELIGMNKFRSYTFRVIAGGVAVIDVLSKLTWAPEHELIVFAGIPFAPAIALTLLLVAGIVVAGIERQERGFKKFVFPLVLIASLGITFIRPIYIDDWQKAKTIEVPQVQERLDSLYNAHFDTKREDDIFLAAFFTTGCKYCKEIGKKMGIAARRGDLKNTVVFFKTEEEKVQTFLKENHCSELDYQIIDEQTFMFLTQGRFPTLFYSNDKDTYFMRGSKAMNGPMMRQMEADQN